MLIIVSDMHLTDQTLAPSVSPDAFEKFTEEVKHIANKKSEIVKIILLGDIFDVLRSSQWFTKISGETLLYDPDYIKPWDGKDCLLEGIVSSILKGIEKYYSPYFGALTQIENVKLLWVPGNHDRLVKNTDSGKDFLRRIGVQIAGYDIRLDDYGVYARHGHCFDNYNFRDNNYEFAPFGDGIVIEILNKLQVEAAKKRKVNFDNPEIAFLGAIEYISPPLKAPIWIHETTKKLPDKILRKKIREAWAIVIDSFVNNSDMMELLTYKKRTLIKYLDKSIKFNVSIARLWFKFGKLAEKKGKYLKKASKESVIDRSSIQYVVYGHTHNHGTHPFKKKYLYINTGWWERTFEPLTPEGRPIMKKFHMLLIDKDKRKPILHPVEINSEIPWTPPYKEPISPDKTFEEAQRGEVKTMNDVLLEKGVIDLFSLVPGIKIKSLENPRKKGFNMTLKNDISSSIFGRDVAVEVKHKIKIPDIDMLAENVQRAGFDRGWIFTLGKVSEASKTKALGKKINIFDVSDINKLIKGESFHSILK